MPSTRDIRRRIRSIRNTAQITKAMEKVAQAKMRRAQQVALAGRPYATLMNEVLAAASAGAGDFRHAFIEPRPVKHRALIVVSTDKGLCGALNTNLLREAVRYDKDTTLFLCAGRKGAQWAGRMRRQLVAEFTYKDPAVFADARTISKFAQDLYLEGKVDQVDVLFTNFVNTLTQKPEIRQLLPIVRLQALKAGLHDETQEELAAGVKDYLFEPAAGQVLGSLLPHYLNYQVYQYLQEARASEHSSRMVAMKNATDNAKQIIKDLTLEYNKLRQANITKELLEITTAAMAMGS